MSPAPLHIPVMLNEVLHALDLQPGGTYVDGTFGAGGYSQAILNRVPCQVYAIDRDPDAIERGKKLEAHHKSFHILEGNFGDMDRLLEGQGVTAVDGVVLDLGVSSPQLDEADRGFSFQKEGPLDMRMSQKGPTAADIVNNFAEERLAHIIWAYGDEPSSRSIARTIVAARSRAPILTTFQLRDIVHKSLRKRGSGKIDPATKTFQAFRIYVNEELDALDKGLRAAERLLKVNGRLVVVAFHSLEDERVKRFFRTRSGKTAGVSRHVPAHDVTSTKKDFPFALTVNRSLAPSDAEIRANPRARSARLRFAVRTSAQSLPDDDRDDQGGRP